MHVREGRAEVLSINFPPASWFHRVPDKSLGSGERRPERVHRPGSP
jgi:hypothetical protein